MEEKPKVIICGDSCTGLLISIQQVLRKYNLNIEDVVIVEDDIDKTLIDRLMEARPLENESEVFKLQARKLDDIRVELHKPQSSCIYIPKKHTKQKYSKHKKKK